MKEYLKKNSESDINRVWDNKATVEWIHCGGMTVKFK